MPAPKPVHIRIERDLLKRIDYLCADHDMFRTDAIEMLLEKSFEAIEDGDWDIDEIVAKYEEDEEEGEE